MRPSEMVSIQSLTVESSIHRPRFGGVFVDSGCCGQSNNRNPLSFEAGSVFPLTMFGNAQTASRAARIVAVTVH